MSKQLVQAVKSGFAPAARGGMALLLATIVAAGCVTPRSMEPNTATPMFKNRLLEEAAARKEVEHMRRYIEAGQYAIVPPRLLYLINKYPHPESEAALEARYWLGVTYSRISSYRDAITLFEEYLRLAPDGEYVEDASKQLAALQHRYEQEYWTAPRLDAAIEELTAKARSNPDDAAAQMELADLLWKVGSYDEAAAIYAKLAVRFPEYRRAANVANRIEFGPDNTYTVLTPAEVERRAIELQPLSIFNTNDFHSGEDLFTREARFYSVTGQVMNRSDSVLYGVQVIVTIYGFGNLVYDTTTYNIGRMNPGETRAFSVRFSNFDYIENVTRYECTATFQR